MLTLATGSALLVSWLAASAAWVPGVAGLHFDELEYQGIRFGHTELQLETGAGGSLEIVFNSDSLIVEDQLFDAVSLSCTARWESGVVNCDDGRIALRHAGLGRLSGRAAFRYDLEHGLQHASITAIGIAEGRADVTLRSVDGEWHLGVTLDDVSLAEIQRLSNTLTDAPVLIELSPLQGRLSTVMTVTGIGTRPSLHADWSLTHLNYSGTSVLEDVALHGELAADRRRDDSWLVDLAMRVIDGEMYVVPAIEYAGTPPGVYIAVPEAGLSMTLTAGISADLQRIGIDRLQYEHPGVLALEAAALLEPAAENPVTALTVHVPAYDVVDAFPVYLQPWLLDTIYNDLEVTGHAGLSLRIIDGRLVTLGMLLEGLSVIDNAGRFALHDLNSDFLVDKDRAGYSTLRWQEIDLYRLNFGPGEIGIASDGLDLRVTEWQDVPILDGLLRIEQLDIGGLGAPDFRIDMAGELVPVSLLTLTEVLEWPPFSGTVGGEFSGLTFRNGDLEVTGELRVRMFDGEVVISGLQVQDLLGRLPILEAGIVVTAIDLERLTDTFAFGRITGRLSGHVSDLRLENWQPVAFDAELSTVADRWSRHRISQQALNNISQIGGGLQGALSRGFLSYFNEYSYGDLGISCRLARGYCELGGVKEADDGHYILTRGGLLPPWVEVRLSGTIVRWDTLIEGFRTIAAGDVRIE